MTRMMQVTLARGRCRWMMAHRGSEGMRGYGCGGSNRLPGEEIAAKLHMARSTIAGLADRDESRAAVGVEPKEPVRRIL